MSSVSDIDLAICPICNLDISNTIKFNKHNKTIHIEKCKKKTKWVCFCLDFFLDPCKNEWEETGFFGNYGGWLF